MKLQNKLTLAFLLMGLITAATVGGVAYWSQMRDFLQSAKTQAFENFSSDMSAYLERYGTLENGERREPFTRFVSRRHQDLRSQRPAGAPNLRPGLPPFRFMILDPAGQVLRDGGDYAIGEQVPETIFNASRAIEQNGQVQLRIVQVGNPVLTDLDRQYLAITHRALLTGILIAAAFSVMFGLILGRKLCAPLQKLTDAIANMSLTKGAQAIIPVSSSDEIGLLTAAYNEVSVSLQQTYGELQQSHARIEEQARVLHDLSIRDPLTCLFNRRYFDEQATNTLRQAIRQERSLTLMIGDIDHFKKINDQISHATGDEVLKQVSAILRKNTRSTDLVARYGGEEFVIAFFDSSLEQAAQFCEKIRGLIEQHPWQEIHPDLRVTISMGLSSDISLKDIEKMLAKADEQLYVAKNQGRNRIMPQVLNAAV